MNITSEWLTKNRACEPGIQWFQNQNETDGIAVVEKLIAEEKSDWVNWLIISILDRKQKIAYAVFAAEQVLEIYEKQYPNDTRPRQAIDAARLVVLDDSAENRNVAADAANAADIATNAATADAYVAANAATAAAYVAANAYAYGIGVGYDATMKTKIITFGIQLLK